MKKTGEVYKSWRDWDAELCLTRDQVARVHREGFLEAVGIIRRQRQTAKGNPIHYLLDVDMFLAKLAAFVNMTVATLIAWMDSKPSTENPEIASGESQQATTTDYPTNKNSYNRNNTNNNSDHTSNEKVVVESVKLLKIPNMPTKLLIALVQQYGFERVQAVYDYAKQQKARNMGGFVRQGLKQGWEIEDVPPQKAGWEKYTDSKYDKYRKDGLLDMAAIYFDEYGDRDDGRDYAGGKYADFVES